MKRWKKICLENYKPYSLENSQYASKKQKKKARAFYKKYGFRYEETWNLDHTLACYILPRLAYLRDTTHGYPNAAGNFENWQLILDKMIDAFEQIALEDEISNLTQKEYEERERKIKEGLVLFGAYFQSLWD